MKIIITASYDRDCWLRMDADTRRVWMRCKVENIENKE